MMMLWRRQHVFREGVSIARYVSVDASPQGGYDYFVCHQEVMARDEMAPVDHDDVFGGFEWDRYMLPITCLGAQDTSTVHKTVKLIQAAALETGDAFKQWREQVRGFCSDQGSAERNVVAAPVLAQGDDSVDEAINRLLSGEVNIHDRVARDAQFLPNAIQQAGTKHVLYNALRESITQHPEYRGWKEILNVFLRLIGAKEYRTRFIAKCMRAATPAEIENVRKVNRKYLDWKWESAEDILYFVLLAVPPYKRYYSAEAYGGTELTADDHRELYKVKHDECWLGITLVIQNNCRAVGHEGRWISGSPRDLLREGVSHPYHLPAATRAGKHERRAAGVEARDERPQEPDFWTGRWAALFA